MKSNNSHVVVHKEENSRARRFGAIGLVALVLIGLSVGGYYGYRALTKKEPQKQLTAYEKEEQKAKDIFAKKDADAVTAAKQKLDAAKTPAEKSAAYVALSNAASAEGDTKAASDYAQKAVEANQTIESLVAAAFQAEKNSDYKQAAEYYGKAADMARQTGGANAEAEYLNYKSMQEAAEKRI